MSSPSMFSRARRTDARWSTFTNIGRDQINCHNTYNYYGAASPTISSEPLQIPVEGNPRGFNNAPVNDLSIHFTCRESELADIEKALSDVFGDLPTHCIIYGSQGLGKSQLMLQFAKEFGWRYSYVVWISASTTDKLIGGYANLLDEIDHPERMNLDQDYKVKAARRWLEGVDADWVLLIDNVNPTTIESVREYLPRTNRRGNIIFTTITEALANKLAEVAGQRHKVIELPLPDVENAAKMLMKHFEGAEMDTNKVEEVIACIGRLPLVIAHAATIMKNNRKNLDDILHLYQSNKFEVFDWELDLPGYGRKSIAGILLPRLDDLEKNSPEVSNLLKMLSYLDPERIPLDIITDGAKAFFRSPRNTKAVPPKHIPELDQATPQRKRFWFPKIKKEPSNSSNPPMEVGSSLTGKADEKPANSFASSELGRLLSLMQSNRGLPNAIEELQSRSLIRYQPKTNAPVLCMHDLEHFFVQDRVKGQGARCDWIFDVAVRIVCGAFRCVRNPISDEHWARCEMFLPHIRLLTAQKIALSDNGLIGLMKTSVLIAEYLHIRARYTEAERLYDLVRNTYEKHFGKTHSETLLVIHKLADVYDAQGRWYEAKELYEKLLAEREEALGPEHSDTLATMHYLAIIHQRLGQQKQAENFFKRILAIDEKRLKPNHPDTLSTIENLANVYVAQSRYDEAQGLYGQVLAQLGADDPQRFSVMHDLAQVYISRVQLDEYRNRPNDPRNRVSEYRNRLPEAEKLLKEVQKYKTERRGAEHPDTLRVAFDLAQLYQTEKQYSDAIELFEQVLDSRRKQLGLEHPDTLATMQAIARVHTLNEDYNLSKELLVRVLQSTEKLHGRDHLVTRQVMYDLGKTYRSLQQFEEAEKMLEEVLKGDREDPERGSTHPNTVSSMRQLAKVYRGQGLKEKWRALYKEADEIAKANGHVI